MLEHRSWEVRNQDGVPLKFERRKGAWEFTVESAEDLTDRLDVDLVPTDFNRM